VTPIAKVEDTVTLAVTGGRRIRFASLPKASVHQIVSATGDSKRVGVVMVGGTREQFEHHISRHRELCLVRGNRTGPYIHAQSGLVELD
jgi:hypothetical protein